MKRGQRSLRVNRAIAKAIPSRKVKSPAIRTFSPILSDSLALPPITVSAKATPSVKRANQPKRLESPLGPDEVAATAVTTMAQKHNNEIFRRALIFFLLVWVIRLD
jgi:hypothetical protein